MGWVRIDDAYYDHPAHAALELDAWGLWLWSLAWSNRNLSDGKVPAAIVKRMDPDGKATGALIDAGRWEPVDGGVAVHAYLDWQPSADDVRAKRAKERDRWQRRTGSDATPTEPVAPSADPPQPLRAELARTPRASQTQPQASPTGDVRAFGSDFDAWWSGYPRKIDRKAAFAAYKARRREGVPPAVLLAARDHYAASVAGSDPKFVKHGSTFLAKGGPWSEWVDGPPPGASAGGRGNLGAVAAVLGGAT